MRQEMSEMEKELSAEIKRRCEVAKSLQSVSWSKKCFFFILLLFFFQWLDDQIEGIEIRFHRLIDDKSDEMNEKLGQLSQRMDRLEMKFDGERKEIIDQIEEQGSLS